MHTHTHLVKNMQNMCIDVVYVHARSSAQKCLCTRKSSKN